MADETQSITTEGEVSQEVKPQKQHEKQQFDWLKEYQWQKGQSGNPGGRPKGAKSLKTWAREFIESMSDEARLEFLRQVDPDMVWKMAEGQPHQSNDTTVEVKPTPLLNALRNNNSSSEDSGNEAKD